MVGDGVFDQGERPLRDLRISVMDRCNFRCPYCMPKSAYPPGFQFLSSQERLTFAEIVRLAQSAAELGVIKLRLTGGEPLLRPKLPDLIRELAQIPGIEDIALTTNGILLAKYATDLRKAGLHRLTISLDSLDAATFRKMAGTSAKVQDVLSGITIARDLAFPKGIKINTVVQRALNDHSVLPLVEHFRGSGIIVRFIEFMDVGNCNGWSHDYVVPSSEIRRQIHARWPLKAIAPLYRGEVASRYQFIDNMGEIGFVSSVSSPFCGTCSRARLSSDGKLFTCLFAHTGFDLRPALRDPNPEILKADLAKIWRGRSDRYSEVRAQIQADNHDEKIEMHYIGG